MTGQSRRGNWSVQELERLRQLLPRRGVEVTATLLRRSAASVQRKALQILRVPPRRGDWTDSDDSLLRESWGAVEARLLATMLGRPIADVQRRATRLRTQLRRGSWQHQERQRLKELFATRADIDLEVCLSRPRDEIQAMARALCLAKDKRFLVQEAVRRHRAEPSPGRQGATMPRWTADEVERLRAIYADRDNLEVARALGRSVTSVANKANQLGLHKEREVLASIGRLNVGIRHGSVDGAGA